MAQCMLEVATPCMMESPRGYLGGRLDGDMFQADSSENIRSMMWVPGKQISASEYDKSLKHDKTTKLVGRLF